MRSRDRLVEEACRRAEVLRAAAHDSHVLMHPERPVREVPEDEAAHVAGPVRSDA